MTSRQHRFATGMLALVFAALAWGNTSHLPTARLLALPLQASSAPGHSIYEVRAIHDPNGTGRFYMGREIAQVMGPGGISWLDRPERETEERPDVVINALSLQKGDVVADLGAGSGFFSFRMAAKVGNAGKVLAVDIQDEMIDTIRQRATAQGITNVEAIKGTQTDPHLPVGGVDLVLMVDVYHELEFPYEVMVNVYKDLKPGGRVAFVEYRKEDPSVPIKEVHKMTIDQLTKEMAAVGLVRIRTVESLPSQHIVIFAKAQNERSGN